jgi:hypothetical protein
MKKNSTSSYDILGISTATLCLIHCTVFPILTIIPFGFYYNVLIDTLFACIAMLVVSKILMSKAAKNVKYILGVSIIIIVTSIILDIFFKLHLQLISIGGIGMIIGHFLNYKSHKPFNSK